MTDLTRTTLGELYKIEHRDELDRVVRSIALSTGGDYLSALRWLEAAAESAAESYAGQREQVRPEALSLAAVIGGSELRLTRFEADLLALEADAEAAERVLTLDATAPEGQEVDELGRVRLASEPPDGERVRALSAEVADDRARRLTDPHELESAYQRCLAIDDARYAGEEGRQRFEAEHRGYVAAGLDLPATLERREGEAELAHRRDKADRAQRKLERIEAEHRQRRRS